MNAHQYAQALHTAILDGTSVSQALTGLDHVLAKRGHTKLKKRILLACMQLIDRTNEKHTATVHVARDADITALATTIRAAATELGADVPDAVVVDESLIGGFVITTPNQRLDKSYKRALLNLFRSITRSQPTTTN